MPIPAGVALREKDGALEATWNVIENAILVSVRTDNDLFLTANDGNYLLDSAKTVKVRGESYCGSGAWGEEVSLCSTWLNDVGEALRSGMSLGEEFMSGVKHCM